VGLARAIIHDPEIILYDEPTSGLDPVSSRTIDHLIDSMRHELGVTSVVVTHDLHSALSIGTRIAMLSGGRIVELAEPAAFVKSEHEEVKLFLESQFITRRGDWEKDMP
jgi:phospholipid/cholesterol/gamma-HCH transport system ATP-binding protein